jgi:hypothetical protein
MASSYDHRDPDLRAADEATGCLLALLFWGVVALFRGIHFLFKELFEPVHPGVLVGHKRSGLRKPVTIPFQALNQHVHCTGATGSGKSTLLSNLIVQLMEAGEGLTVISPKADLIEGVLPNVPQKRVDDVILFEGRDSKRPICLNILEAVDPSLRSRVASEVLTIYHRFFADSWGPRLEYILRMTLMALLECPNTSLACIQPMLVDDAYRQHVLAHVQNPAVLQFWNLEYAALSHGQRTQAIQPVLNKVQALMVYPQVYNILSPPHSTLHIDGVMDKGQVLLVNLPQGLLGEDVSAFLGGLIITKEQTAAMARASQPQSHRRRHTLIVDEVQNYGASSTATDGAFTKLLTEARAFNLSLITACQFNGQLSKGLRDAIEHNVAASLACQVERGKYTLLYSQPQDLGLEEMIVVPRPPLGPGNAQTAATIRQRSRQLYGRAPQPRRPTTSQRTTVKRQNGTPVGVTLFKAP